jgi:glycosyltransferase involved in cell wall biosynthesis
MTCPFICPCPSILVIHDLQHINQPQNFSKHYLLFLKSIIYLSAKRADGIITISQKVKQDITSHYKIKPDNISVIYHAADNTLFHMRNEDEIKAVREKYGLPENFLLYTASSLPHKNHERLLEAFKIIKDRYNAMKLVLTGARDYGHDIISKDINRMGLGNDVIFLGWLPFEDMPAVYCSSRVFIFPSLHEGFGIPVLEAMACGVPVVCSDIEPLNEVADDAALFIDPYDPHDIAEGVSRILRDIELRESLINKGYKRAGEFSWERTALNTLSALNSYMET